MYKDFFMHICKRCNTEFETSDKLRRHVGRKHNVSSQEFYNEHILNGKIPKCKCGCGEVPVFRGFVKGYGEWLRGHISRVKNNWGHNEFAIEKSAETRREQYKNGQRKVWNLGLTKETDLRVAEYGKHSSASIKANSSELKRRKLHAEKQWQSGAFSVKWGKESHGWKGGTSSINNLIRVNKRLYNEWIYPILCENGFKCQNCKLSKQLEVHHNDETMAEIISKYVDKTKEYTFDEKREIMNIVIDYHISNNVSGEVLCKSCHKKLHPSYNY
jgi:hypothetical protein